MKYTVTINQLWPYGAADSLLGVFDNETGARMAAEAALQVLYPDQWQQINKTQYAALYSAMNGKNVPMANIHIQRSPAEEKAWLITIREKHIAKLKEELVAAEQDLEDVKALKIEGEGDKRQ